MEAGAAGSMGLSKDKIEALAPDQASLGAALKLQKPGNWPLLARDASASLLWGECQGSGSTPYRVIVSPDDVGYKCTCPSRKFPCKHVLAVMWTHADKPERLTEGTTPDWVKDWLSKRRPKSNEGPPKEITGKPGASLATALAEAVTEAIEKPVDPKAAARADAQRQRLRDEREASVRDGLDELDRWIMDQLNLGLSAFPARAQTATRAIATRLVDAKAQGLATRIDALSSEIFRVPEPQRGDLAIERLATLSLMTAAYRHQDQLPAALRADLRRAVGWTVKREELLGDPDALHVTSGWIVAAARSEAQPDKLRRLETWLLNTRGVGMTPRVALLVDYVPVSAGASASPFVPGETLEAEVVFYPSAAPLRAQLVTRRPAAEDAVEISWPVASPGLDVALADYEMALARLPWLDTWPVSAGGVALALVKSGPLVLVDRSGRTMPIEPGQADDLMPLIGLTDLAVIAAWDGRTATVLALTTPYGVWHEGR
jgi:hypothetical protein